MIFIIGLPGTNVFAALTTSAPDVLRKIIYRWTGTTPDQPPPGGGGTP